MIKQRFNKIRALSLAKKIKEKREMEVIQNKNLN